MHIVVCLKQVIDPEIPSRYFKLDPETNRPIDDGTMVMDSYAENALESAIQLRDKVEGAKVTALCLGDEDSEDVLRQALSFTADEAVRVWDEDFEELDLDGQVVGHILAKAIKTIGGADLVLTGYQASDIEEGLVGPVIAEELSAPCVTLVSDLEQVDQMIRVTCEAENGYDVREVPTPAVLTIVSSEKNVPRLPKVKDKRLARSKPIRELELDDLEEIDQEKSQSAVTLERVFIQSRDVACEILTGDDGEELAGNLAGKLFELKVL